MLFKRFRKTMRAIRAADSNLSAVRELLVSAETDRLKQSAMEQGGKSLIPFGAKVYSQNEEDGIIREIFNRIGTSNKVFVEFGIGDGLENNTLALLFDDWKGLWIEASSTSVKKIQQHFASIIESGDLSIIESFITRDNINDLIASKIQEAEIDLLSVDIDGNDYHVLESISCVNPRVIAIEYNAKFMPPIQFCMNYDASHNWAKDDCFGVSLKFLEVNLAKKGYCLVGCDLVGVNAFFVRQDLVGDKFLQPYTAENHFQPARYYLSNYLSGHPASYRALAQSFAMRRRAE